MEVMVSLICFLAFPADLVPNWMVSPTWSSNAMISQHRSASWKKKVLKGEDCSPSSPSCSSSSLTSLPSYLSSSSSSSIPLFEGCKEMKSGSARFRIISRFFLISKIVFASGIPIRVISSTMILEGGEKRRSQWFTFSTPKFIVNKRDIRGIRMMRSLFHQIAGLEGRELRGGITRPDFFLSQQILVSEGRRKGD